MEQLATLFSIAASLATVVATILAAIGAVFAWHKYRQERRFQMELSLLDASEKYARAYSDMYTLHAEIMNADVSTLNWVSFNQKLHSFLNLSKFQRAVMGMFSNYLNYRKRIGQKVDEKDEFSGAILSMIRDGNRANTMLNELREVNERFRPTGGAIDD
ncbi:hypothetical protein [Maricaulis sp.]|uniref:hypothetical protein n=1 Tax=Maricaulis sp. TaxID=1486257 RepID=UPI0032985A45